MIYCPFLERVTRQYERIQIIFRHSSIVPELNVIQMDRAFQDFFVACYTCGNAWSISGGNLTVCTDYIVWFYMLSHPKLVAPFEGELPRPANVEVLIDEEHGRDNLDTF